MNQKEQAKADKQKSEKRKQIREAAYRRFRDKGYNKTTVDDICDEADCSKGSFYWHYNSKQEVFVDILNSWAQQVIPEIFEQFEASLRGKEDSIGMITNALEQELRRGRTILPMWLEFTVRARREEEIRESLAKFYRRARSAIADVLRPSIHQLFTEDELQGVANVIFGAYMGVVMQELTDPELVNAQRAVEQFMVVLAPWIHYLQNPPPAP